MRALVVWLLVALAAGWAAVRVLGLEQGFPLVPLLAYTPFAVVGAGIAVLVAAVFRQRTAALVALLSTLALVAVVAPRALGGPSEPDGGAGPQLRVLTANMRFGHGSVDALMALARRDVDVLSVQELTPELAARLDAAGLRELMPERVVAAREGGGGMGLYSRVPLLPNAVIRSTTNASPIGSPQIADAPPVDVVAVHPVPPVRSARVAVWRADLRALPAATPGGRLRILAGDFNATLDHAELRKLLGTGYEDAAAQVGEGLQWTWPRGRRFPPPVAIDHVLVDSRIGVRAVSVHAIPGTDHRAVLAELTLPRR